MVGLVAIGISAVIVGLIVLRIARNLSAPSPGPASLAGRIQSARTFSEAGPGDHVLLEGHIVEGTDHAVESPLSHRKAVIVEIDATEERSTNPEESFSPLFHLQVAKRFAVSCADRRTIEVRVDDNVELAGLHVTRTGPVVKASDALVAFLRDNGRPPTLADGDFVRRREYAEQCLALGQSIVALGVLQEPDIESRRAGYRAGEHGTPWVKVNFIDASASAETLVARGQPEPPGVGERLGLVLLVGGPALTIVLALAGVKVPTEAGLGAAVVGVPAATAATWVALWFISEMFL